MSRGNGSLVSVGEQLQSSRNPRLHAAVMCNNEHFAGALTNFTPSPAESNAEPKYKEVSAAATSISVGRDVSGYDPSIASQR
jgi:hypothetical protein